MMRKLDGETGGETGVEGVTGKAWSDKAWADTTSPEERADYRKQRADCVKRYGEAIVASTVEKAARHKARAKTFGLCDHFTPWQWLDLLAEYHFLCPICRIVDTTLSLEAHHIHELSKGGVNTIANILPVCHFCHILLHETRITYRPQWYKEQQELCNNFHVGDWVQPVVHHLDRSFSSGPDFPDDDLKNSFVEIVELFPPEKLPGDVWLLARPGYPPLVREGKGLVNSGPCQGRSIVQCCEALIFENGEAIFCRHAYAMVKQTCGEYQFRSDLIPLQELVPFDREPWQAKQQSLCKRFQIGTMVNLKTTAQDERFPRVVVEVFPAMRLPIAKGGYWQPASARLYLPWNGSPDRDECRHLPVSSLPIVPLTQLSLKNSATWLADQQKQHEAFQVGDIVRRKHGSKKKHGIVTRLTAPELGPSWHEFSGGKPFDLSAGWMPWRRAEVRVKWISGAKPNYQNHEPALLVRVADDIVQSLIKKEAKQKRAVGEVVGKLVKSEVGETMTY